MIDEKFRSFRADFLDECHAISDAKVKDYAHDGDRLANFKRIASETNMYPEIILLVYMHKHMDSIHRFIGDLKYVVDGTMSIEELDNDLSEPIEGRIKDAINYLLLLAGLVAERRGNG